MTPADCSYWATARQVKSRAKYSRILNAFAIPNCSWAFSKVWPHANPQSIRLQAYLRLQPTPLASPFAELPSSNPGQKYTVEGICSGIPLWRNTAMLSAKKTCPRCGCEQVYRSRRRVFEKGFLSLLDWVPFRCAGCNHRFYSKNNQPRNDVSTRQTTSTEVSQH